ncbi:phosphate acetyltransferase [Sneathiella marina]|uniref:Phosphate acetyltransferase n=1 Tax=Sneathiella marina TaxID=2950108 RepID=A0ABY4W164_9PROT|nr:phosphate acetyltransferase [Sneathiella marina]USG60950.1 phosphate acetyltransferase [Sneathiella marina]
MKQFDDLIARAKSAPKHIVLAEGQDPRIVAGAVRALQEKIATITLLGPVDEVRGLARAAGDSNDQITIIDPAQSAHHASYSEEFLHLRRHKGLNLADAEIAVRDCLNFANMMVRSGDADGSVAGARHMTADVVRSALQVIGVDQRYSMVSSFTLMIMGEEFHPVKTAVLFTDCGLVVSPDEDELAQIAAAAADSLQSLLQDDPKIAMLSFSTRGSAVHPDVTKVENAAALLQQRRPGVSVEPAIQFDAAFVPEIATLKAPGSDVAGAANVFVFPDLNSGNIGYKIAERIGRAKTIGPVLQGLAKPANDLSRGCDADAVYGIIAVTVLQAQNAV